MYYSKRQLYALGETLGDSVTQHKVGGGRIYGGGGGGSAPAPSTAPTQTTVQNTNIPDYAQPYVESMLGATQQQLFNTNTDANGNVNITGIKPYQPYSQNPSDYVAGFSPLQQQAQQGAANLQVPGQIGAATGATAYGIGNAMNMSANATPQDFQNQVGGYMNPYIQNTLQPAMQLLNQQYGQQAAQQQGQATQQGAFGGSREALMGGLNQQNQMLAQNQLVGNAYNQAFGAAQNQYNQSGAFQLQANQAAMQNANQLAQLGGQQLNAQQGILSAQNAAGAQQQAQQQQIINQGIQNYAVAQQYPQQQLAFMNAQLRGLPLQSSTVQQYQAAPSAISQAAGLGTAGIAGLGLYNAMNTTPSSSDIRVKENIEFVDILMNGVNIYEFDYKPEFKDKSGYGRYRGVMADEVEQVMPQAVGRDSDGYKTVHYSMLGIKMEEV